MSHSLIFWKSMWNAAAIQLLRDITHDNEAIKMVDERDVPFCIKKTAPLSPGFVF